MLSSFTDMLSMDYPWPRYDESARNDASDDKECACGTTQNPTAKTTRPHETQPDHSTCPPAEQTRAKP